MKNLCESGMGFYFHTFLSRDKLGKGVVGHATSLYNSHGINVAQQVWLKCCLYSAALKPHGNLKWYYDQKIISFFSSDFESVFA